MTRTRFTILGNPVNIGAALRAQFGKEPTPKVRKRTVPTEGGVHMPYVWMLVSIPVLPFLAHLATIVIKS